MCVCVYLYEKDAKEKLRARISYVVIQISKTNNKY